jgi:hypothetical protein
MVSGIMMAGIIPIRLADVNDRAKLKEQTHWGQFPLPVVILTQPAIAPGRGHFLWRRATAL